MIDALRAILLLCWLASFANAALDTLHRGLSPLWLFVDLGLSGLAPALGLYLLKDNG